MDAKGFNAYACRTKSKSDSDSRLSSMCCTYLSIAWICEADVIVKNGAKGIISWLGRDKKMPF